MFTNGTGFTPTTRHASGRGPARGKLTAALILAALTGIAAQSATAATASAAASHAQPRPVLPVRVERITTHGVTAVVTIRGNWHLIKVPGHLAPTANKPGTGRAASPNGFGLGNSPYWSGYSDTGTAFNYVTADFNAPNVNCAASLSPIGGAGYTQVDPAVGLGGPTGNTWTWNYEQAGYTAGCNAAGQFKPYVWYYTDPTQLVAFRGVAAGDALRATVRYNQTAGQYTLTVTDLTQNGAGISATVADPSGSDSSAEVIGQAMFGGPPSGVNLADFGAVSFTSAVVTSTSGIKGTLASNGSWTGTNLTMIDPTTHNTMAVATVLQGNTAFEDLWHQAN
jgi:hypothetical protein